MYVRIVRGHPQPGQAEEVARRWSEHLAPRLKSVPGFRQGYLSVDRATNQIAGITIWDDKPGAAADQAAQGFQDQLQDITSGPPEIATYEVLAEV